MNKILLAAALFACSAANVWADGVTAREGSLTLPSYTLDAPEKAPIFERDWSYQRARRSVYPYVLNDNMTTRRDSSTYKALYLENDYVELCILPEIGGRLFYFRGRVHSRYPTEDRRLDFGRRGVECVPSPSRYLACACRL